MTWSDNIVVKNAQDRINIENLKRQWIHDPIWDIEDTEGFEAYHDELLQWRLEREANIKAEIEHDLQTRADAAKCDIETMRVIQGLEYQIARLQRQIDALREEQNATS